MIFIPFILTIIYTIAWVYFQKYQFAERDQNILRTTPKFSDKWHYWKGMNQLVFFITLGFAFGWQIALCNAIIYWVLFDSLLNKIVLKKSLNYIGKTSKIDLAQHNIAKYIFMSPYTFSAILKTLLVIISISILLIF